MKRIVRATARAFAAASAMVEGPVSDTTDQNFDDVIFGQKNAIPDQGLLIANISHVGDMLKRTRAVFICPRQVFICPRQKESLVWQPVRPGGTTSFG